jgi:peptide/nickel transport system ATP-binding protein
MAAAGPLLAVGDLHVSFSTEDGVVRAVDGVSYAVAPGRTLGIVGESGSGKTVSCLATMGLARSANARVSGSIAFDGRDLAAASDEDLRRIRGNEIAMIFQDPLSALHPFFRVGDQLVEAVRAHRDVGKREALDRALEMLDLVGIGDARRRARGYPHELSGGMRQRVMIAMALVNDPKLLIADEPTTALDVTVQAQILDLLARLQAERGMAIVLITHDLGIVAEIADEVAVMYAGRIVEHASTAALFAAPEHPYTWGLLRSIPGLDRPREEDLVAIPGRPPSLIDVPRGCRFHPRCPYVREAHRRVEPPLEAVAGDPAHRSACLLDGGVRRALWGALRAGATPDEARRAVGLAADASRAADAPAAAAPAAAAPAAGALAADAPRAVDAPAASGPGAAEPAP